MMCALISVCNIGGHIVSGFKATRGRGGGGGVEVEVEV